VNDSTNDLDLDLDRADDEALLSQEVSDEVLEAAAGGKTQICFYPSQSGLYDPGLDCTCFST
jgi:hypothetical protein